MSTIRNFETTETLRQRLRRIEAELAEEKQRSKRFADDNARLQEERDRAEKVAYLDPLTEVQNRRQLSGILEREIARAKPPKKRKSPASHFCIAFIDVDHFKRINDSHGHLVGDQVLVVLAGILKQNRRLTDFIIRYGGEEFVIVLSNCDLKGAHTYLKRLQKTLHEQFSIKIDPEEPLCPTVSIGLAQWLPDMSQERLIQDADRAMYRAKNMGRNRICIA